MHGSWAKARLLVVALGGGLFLAGACAHRPPAATPAAAEPTGALTSEQERRTEAVALFAAGVSAEMRRGMDAALDYYRRAFATDPQNVELGVGIGKVLVSRREYAEAEALLHRVAQHSPKSAEPLFWLGVIHKSRDQLPAAVAALQRAIKLDPQHINGIHLLTEIYLLQTNVTDVVKLLDYSYRQKSADSAYWMRLGDLFTMSAKQLPVLTNHFDATRAQRSYEKAQALAPEERDIALRLAAVYEEQGDFEKAVALYRAEIKRRPDEVPLRLKLFTLLLRAGDKADAAAELAEVIKREPLRPELYNQLAALYEELDDTDKALDNFQQSLVINPDQPEVYLQIAMLQMAQKKFSAARETLARWRERSPTDFRIPYLTGMMLADEKQYPEAVAAYRDAETLAAEAPREIKLNAQFYFAYGAACERAGDLEKAAELFQKVIALDPADHMAHNYLGYMWADKGLHLEEAHRLIVIANERQPNNGAYLDSLGWVLYRLGRVEEALPHLLRAADLEKDDPTVYEHLAEVLEKLGRHAEAIQYLRRAVNADPDNKALAEKLEKLSGQ